MKTEIIQKKGLDPWLPTTPPRTPQLLPTADPHQPVNQLIDEDTHHWSIQCLVENIHPFDHPLIHKIFLPTHSKQDSIIWSCTTNGELQQKFGNKGYRQNSSTFYGSLRPKQLLFRTI